MNSGAHQKVIPRLKKSLVTLRLLAFVIVAAFAKMELIPTYPGLMTAVIILIETFLRVCISNSHASQDFRSLSLSLSPIWILYFDPCALIYAQVLSVINTRDLVLEENRKKHRVFYLLLAILSWLIIVVVGKWALTECPVSISDNLRGDSILILTQLYFGFAATKQQVNSILSELKETLTEVKELNSKLEVLNKELKQSLNEKDNFILLFSHETRNPLNILMGNLTLLVNEVGNTQYKTKLERCKFCADLLLQQLNNILDSGKLANRGTLELSPTPVNVQDYIQSISSFMEMLIKKKGAVKSELIIPECLPTTLRFDMQRFTQVGLNLLTNALKFTNSGSISLVIRYLRKNELQESDYYPSTDFGYRLLSSSCMDEPSSAISSETGEELSIGSHIGYKKQFSREIANLRDKKKSFTGVLQQEKGFLKIEVNDTGCGIQSEDMKKLFKKFSQTHSDVAQLQLGSGLGLWITKILCELMGGDVRAYSLPSVGSCFVAIIQADCLPSSFSALIISENSPTNLISSKPSQIKRILLVDDDPFNLEFHTQIINSLGYTSIEPATDGQKLFEQFKQRPEGYFEAVVTDISMPILDGIGAAKKIRQFEEEEKRSIKVKIGFITGHSNQKDKVICEENPLDCLFYLSKPIKPAILETFLPSLLDPSQKNLAYSPNTIMRSNKLLQAQLRPSSPLILCIDDDIYNLDFLDEMMKNLGARTIKARSHEQALDLLKSVLSKNEEENIPKLVLMDYKIGRAASQTLKDMFKREFDTEVPIIGISGENKHQNLEKVNLSGMNEILRKPIQREELENLINRYA